MGAGVCVRSPAAKPFFVTYGPFHLSQEVLGGLTGCIDGPLAPDEANPPGRASAPAGGANEVIEIRPGAGNGRFFP